MPKSDGVVVYADSSLDIKASNIMLDTPDKSILKGFEDAELDSPSSRKILDGRTIYKSRKFVFPKSTGFSVLCDFGEARRGIFNHNGLIQPEIYRAPEVILDMHWDYKVDIWMVGVMVTLPAAERLTSR